MERPIGKAKAQQQRAGWIAKLQHNRISEQEKKKNRDHSHQPPQPRWRQRLHQVLCFCRTDDETALLRQFLDGSTTPRTDTSSSPFGGHSSVMSVLPPPARTREYRGSEDESLTEPSDDQIHGEYRRGSYFQDEEDDTTISFDMYHFIETILTQQQHEEEESHYHPSVVSTTTPLQIFTDAESTVVPFRRRRSVAL